MNHTEIKRRRAWLLRFLSLILLLNAPLTLSKAHDQLVHQMIALSASDSSQGLAQFLADNSMNGNTFLSFNSQPRTLTDWIAHGAFREDDRPRWGDHFYTVTPARVPGRAMGLTDSSESLFILPGDTTNSYAWGAVPNILSPFLDGNPPTPTNTETWECARAYEFAALTNSDQTDRDAYMGHMFYALGHILHLNEDLTSPDHVRNDEHFITFHRYIENYGVQNYLKNPRWFVLPQNPTIGWPNWQAKGFSSVLDFWDRGHYVGNAAALDADVGGSDKLGLAEWSNGNFLGEDAIYKEYFSSGDQHFFPFPSLKNTVQGRNFNGSLLASLDTVTLEGVVTGKRPYIEKDGAGIHMQHHSVLKYLGVRHPPRMANPEMRAMLTIHDDKVLQEYHQYLIPRAVEYSTGLLDYFFRGTLDVSVMDLGDGTCQMTIKNTSSQDFKGGAFHLYYDRDGFRTELTDADFSDYSGALAADATMMANFDAQAMATNYVLIYQGTIGTTGGQASDPVDDSIAIAAKNLAGWANDEQTGAASCYGGGTQTVTVGAGTIYSFTSKADADARALALAQSQAQSQCPCKPGDSLALNDAAWMPYDDPYCGQLSADGWIVSGGTAIFNSTESESGGQIYYNTSGGICQTICVPTPGHKIHFHISGSSQAGNPLVWCAGPGFGFYFNQWGGISEDGFDSEADLSVGSNELAFKLCGSPFAEGPIHVEINFEIIAPSV